MSSKNPGLFDEEAEEERIDERVARSRDLEEAPDVLNQYSESPNFWEKKQRDIVTSVVDYNLQTLANLIGSQKIDLSPRYQRRHRWKAPRQSALIESFLMNVPVPPIFLNEDAYGQYSVIDGKQRLTAVTEFFRNRLKLTGLSVFKEINGDTFDDLPSDLQAVIETRAVLRAVIVLRQSDADIKFEVFRRLNTGGVRLNPQEIRNSTWPGPLNDLVLDLSESKDFRRILGVGQKDERTSAIVREMRDAEFVLRYMTFADTWATFSGGMMRQMDTYMSKNQNASRGDLARLRARFVSTLSAVEAAFGEGAFRRWQPDKGAWRKPVVASLFDAQMFAAQEFDPQALRRARTRILKTYKALFDDPEFRRAIDAATNTPSLFKARIEGLRSVLAQATQ